MPPTKRSRQRLQCRDLFDLWLLFEEAGVDPRDTTEIFHLKAEHRNLATPYLVMALSLPLGYPARQSHNPATSELNRSAVVF